jgi:hypothetical protein
MAMMIGKRKCPHCGIFFQPNPRNAKRQKFCSKPACRKAAKAASQKRWLQKPENRDYFHGPENVHRVQEWRRKHPGYARKKVPRAPDEQEPLQDLLPVQATENKQIATTLPRESLQDLLPNHHLVLIGLIAHLTNSPLQDDIAFTARRLQQLGNDILNNPTQSKGATHDPKATRQPAGCSPDPQAVQLSGSASGP